MGGATTAGRRPLDARLARRLVAPLRHGPLTPNHITTLALLAGLAAGGLYATGNLLAANLGAGLFIFAALLDHADGELARMTGKGTRFGYYYDHLSGAVNYIVLFTGMGVGLRAELGQLSISLGIAAGVAVAGIFALRFAMERSRGRDTFVQPSARGFELEDMMYLVGPITWLGAVQPFLVAAGLGAPVFALWMAWRFRRGTDPFGGRI